MRRFGALLAVFLVALAAAGPCFADDTPSASTTPSAAPAQGVPVPEPYRAEEFSPFLHGLRRFETVVIGSLPLTIFYTSLVFDCYRLVTKSLEAGTIDSRYMPWPFKAANSVALTNDEKTSVLLAAVGASVLVGVLDMIIVRAKLRAEERRKAARAAEARKQALEAEGGLGPPGEPARDADTPAADAPLPEPGGAVEAGLPADGGAADGGAAGSD